MPYSLLIISVVHNTPINKNLEETTCGLSATWSALLPSLSCLKLEDVLLVLDTLCNQVRHWNPPIDSTEGLESQAT